MQVREILNRVLRAIGEEQIPCSVTTLDNENHIMILEFMNQFKEQVESATYWRALQATLTASITAGSNSATITNATRASRVVRIHEPKIGRLIPLVFDVTDATNPYRLEELDMTMLRYKQITEVQTAPHPLFFVTQPTATGMSILVHPTPTTNRTLSLVMVTPQGYMDVRDLDTRLLIPSRAMTIGTIWYALQERGEELGQGSMFTEHMFNKALDEEVAADSAEAGEFDLVAS